MCRGNSLHCDSTVSFLPLSVFWQAHSLQDQQNLEHSRVLEQAHLLVTQCEWSPYAFSFRQGQLTHTLAGHSGLVIAGLTIEFAATGWRTFFYVSAGISVLTGGLAFFLVPGPLLPNRHLRGQAVDIVGAFLAIAGVVLFVFALADGEGAPQGWKSPYIPACLVVGAVLVAVFWMWERFVEKGGKQPPLMKTSVWSKGRFAIFQLATLCLFGSITA